MINKDSGYSRYGKLGKISRQLISLKEEGLLEKYCNDNNFNYQEKLSFVKASEDIIKKCNYDDLDLIKKFKSHSLIPFLPFK